MLEVSFLLLRRFALFKKQEFNHCCCGAIFAHFLETKVTMFTQTSSFLSLALFLPPFYVGWVYVPTFEPKMWRHIKNSILGVGENLRNLFSKWPFPLNTGHNLASYFMKFLYRREKSPQ